MDDEKPSTKHLVLKPREVIPIDKLARPGDGSAISVQLIHKQNQIAEERARKVGMAPRSEGKAEPTLPPVFKPKDIVPMDRPAGPDDDESIVVPDILVENKNAEVKSGWGKVRHWKRRPSRRNRDFVVGIGSIDLALAWLIHAADPIMFVYGIAAITLVTATAAWIMFFVMDDY